MDPRRLRFVEVEGLAVRTPVGAKLTVGRAQTGTPRETDRFFLVTYETEFKSFGDDRGAYRSDPHPLFRTFNLRSSGGVDIYASPGLGSSGPGVSVFRGTILHAEKGDAEGNKYSAFRLPGKQANGQPWGTPPHRRPVCEGNGEDALRFIDGEFKAIPCPGELCEFRQKFGKRGKPCKFSLWLLFQPRWSSPESWKRAGGEDGKDPDAWQYGLSSPLLMWVTHSKDQSAAAALGLFAEVEKVAAGAGLYEVSLAGLPFVMTLGRKTNPEEGTKYPVVSFSWDLPPGMDLLTALRFQAEGRRLGRHALPAGPPVTARELQAAGAIDIANLAHEALAIEEPRPQGVPAEIVSVDPGSSPDYSVTTLVEGGKVVAAEVALGPNHKAQGPQDMGENAPPKGPPPNGAAQPSLDLAGPRVTLTGGQVQAAREEAGRLGVSFDAFEESFAGGPLAEYLGELGETERSLELRVLREVRSRASEGAT